MMSHRALNGLAAWLLLLSGLAIGQETKTAAPAASDPARDKEIAEIQKQIAG